MLDHNEQVHRNDHRIDTTCRCDDKIKQNEYRLYPDFQALLFSIPAYMFTKQAMHIMQMNTYDCYKKGINCEWIHNFHNDKEWNNAMRRDVTEVCTLVMHSV